MLRCSACAVRFAPGAVAPPVSSNNSSPRCSLASLGQLRYTCSLPLARLRAVAQVLAGARGSRYGDEHPLSAHSSCGAPRQAHCWTPETQLPSAQATASCAPLQEPLRGEHAPGVQRAEQPSNGGPTNGEGVKTAPRILPNTRRQWMDFHIPPDERTGTHPHPRSEEFSFRPPTHRA